MRVLLLAAFLILPQLSLSLAHAEGGDDADSAAASDAAPSHAKGKKAVKSEKETDGTTAPNRFEADTVIKSQYKHEGEQLEVDPD